MYAGLDITKALSPRDGIGHFTAELLGALSDLFRESREDQLFLYSPGRPHDVGEIRERVPDLPENVYLRTGRPRDDGLDLYHSTGWTVPARLGAPLVFTCYDLTILSHPHCHTLDNRIHCLLGTLEAHLADATFLTISQASARELETRLGLDRSRIRVVYPAAAAAFRPLDEAETRGRLARLGVEGTYLLAVGTIEPRKNLSALLEAYAGLPAETRRQHPLVTAGGRGWGLDESELTRGITHLGYVDREDLVALYNGATLFAYPSLAEGFGLPVLEAMACGAPVVTSNVSSLPEVAGEAGRLVDPLEPEEIRAALLDLIERPAERERLSELGLRRAAAFSWKETARKTLELYREAAEQR